MLSLPNEPQLYCCDPDTSHPSQSLDESSHDHYRLSPLPPGTVQPLMPAIPIHSCRGGGNDEAIVMVTGKQACAGGAVPGSSIPTHQAHCASTQPQRRSLKWLPLSSTTRILEQTHPSAELHLKFNDNVLPCIDNNQQSDYFVNASVRSLNISHLQLNTNSRYAVSSVHNFGWRATSCQH